MPNLHEITLEMQKRNGKVVPAPDAVRRKYLKMLYNYTKRPTIIYATSFTVKDIIGDALQINRADIQAFMSALQGIKGDKLDIIIHSSGGSAEATEQIVNYLRSKFSDIRAIIPQNAMSAATMLACAANRIIMGKHSAIGPIDPQISMPSPNGTMYVAPAQSIIDEFIAAQSNVNNQANNPIIWIQKIQQYPPGLLANCQKVIDLSKVLVKEWLSSYMFLGLTDGVAKADSLANWLGDNRNFLTHGRSISGELAISKGLTVDYLEDDQELQDRVLSVFHSTVATFMTTSCVKIIENHNGKGAFLRLDVKSM